MLSFRNANAEDLYVNRTGLGYRRIVINIFTGRARTEAFSFSSKFVILGVGDICDPR